MREWVVGWVVGVEGQEGHERAELELTRLTSDHDDLAFPHPRSRPQTWNRPRPLGRFERTHDPADVVRGSSSVVERGGCSRSSLACLSLFAVVAPPKLTGIFGTWHDQFRDLTNLDVDRQQSRCKVSEMTRGPFQVRDSSLTQLTSACRPSFGRSTCRLSFERSSIIQSTPLSRSIRS